MRDARLHGDGGTRTRTCLVASEVLFQLSYIPRCGRVESNHHSARRRGYSPLSSPVLSVREKEGRPTGFEPVLRGSRPRVLAVTPRPPRAGTTGLEPAASRVTSERSARLSYAPSGAGGIRTHGLELMRLARTAAPLPRSVLQGLAGRSRTCDLRRPKPAGWPSPLQPDELRRQDSNLRLASNSRASYRSTTPERKRKERESNPQGLAPHPFSRRDTAPMAVLPKRSGACRLSYGVEGVVGRSRTCSPRVSGGSSTG